MTQQAVIQTGATTLTGVLAERAARMPDALAYAFLPDGLEQSDQLTWGELNARSLALAAQLRERVEPGSRVLLLLLPGLETVIAQQACFAAGMVGVPAALPNPRRKAHGLGLIQHAATNAGVSAVLSTTLVADFLAADLESAPALAAAPWLLVDQAPDEAPSRLLPEPDPTALAYLQYTSGSTSDPRGVMLTQRTLLSNLTAIQDTWQLGGDARLYTWVPPWHDMGLVAGILLGAYAGVPTYVVPPLAIARKPLNWLKAITDLGITLSGAPDFMYRVCAQRLNDETRRGLDLSSWSSAYFGSEPVKAATVRAFTEATASIGLRPEAISACYGMAESTLSISNSALSAPPVICTFDRERLGAGEVIEIAAGGDNAAEMVGNGSPHRSQGIAVVDPQTHQRVADGRVGEIWTHGPSVGEGYWQQPEATEATFRARIDGDDDGIDWLRTGDSGFIFEGELFISGRLKDVLIVNGVNHHAVDLETAAQGCHPLLASRPAAAFTADLAGITDQIVVVVELPGDEIAAAPETGDELLTAVRRAIANTFDFMPQRIVLVPRGEIPKTTSGKVQRQHCRALLTAGQLPVTWEWAATTKADAA
jgi:acyl-CoA synthetase (AMP-forming)/AMP-acid ligase II